MNPSLAAMLDAIFADGIYIGTGVLVIVLIIVVLWLIFRNR